MYIKNIINKDFKHEPVLHSFINISIIEIIQLIWDGSKKILKRFFFLETNFETA